LVALAILVYAVKIALAEQANKFKGEVFASPVF
jgi:hypothetical protein